MSCNMMVMAGTSLASGNSPSRIALEFFMLSSFACVRFTLVLRGDEEHSARNRIYEMDSVKVTKDWSKTKTTQNNHQLNQPQQ